MKCGFPSAMIAGLLLAFPHQAATGQTNSTAKAPATAVGASDSQISLEDRLFIFSKSYASIQHYFAHWQDVPNIKLDDLYRRYLPEIVATSDRYAFDMIMMRFMNELNNGHSWFRDRWLARTHGGDIGFDFRWLKGQWVVTASRTPGIHAGDILRAIDGKEFESFYQRARTMIDPSSDRAQRTAFASPRYNFVFPMEFTIKTLAGREVPIRRSAEAAKPTDFLSSRWIVPGKIAYLRMTSFNDNDANDRATKLVEGDFHSARALIIDIRGYNGGNTPSALIQALMDRPYRGMNFSTALNVSLFQLYGELYERLKGTMPDADLQELSILNDYFAHPAVLFPGGAAEPGTAPFKGQLFIITDNGVVSAKEDFVAPFKDNHRATIVGEQTAGSTGQPYMFNFNPDQQVAVGAKIAYMPDGSRFEKVGISPDVEVQPTLADLRAGRDTVLLRTIELARTAVGRTKT